MRINQRKKGGVLSKEALPEICEGKLRAHPWLGRASDISLLT